MIDAQGRAPAKLSWSRDAWLHKPTQEVVSDGDPRVPRTIAAAKKQRDWLLVGSQANVDDGFYRRDMDMSTRRADQPTSQPGTTRVDAKTSC